MEVTQELTKSPELRELLLVILGIVFRFLEKRQLRRKYEHTNPAA